VSDLTAPEIPVTAEGSVELFSESLDGVLDSGELVASITSVTEVTSTDLTISNESVSSAALTINGISVAIGKAIQFKVIGQLTATKNYTLKMIVVTDSSPAQTKVRFCKFVVKGS